MLRFDELDARKLCNSFRAAQVILVKHRYFSCNAAEICVRALVFK